MAMINSLILGTALAAAVTLTACAPPSARLIPPIAVRVDASYACTDPTRRPRRILTGVSSGGLLPGGCTTGRLEWCTCLQAAPTRSSRRHTCREANGDAVASEGDIGPWRSAG